MSNPTGTEAGAQVATEVAIDGAFRLQRFVPYRLSVLTNTVSRTLAREYDARFGIGVLEWRVIAVVSGFGPVSAGQVAARSAMDKVAVSRAVSSLLDKRLLRRRTDPEDRRRSLLSLSRRGQRVHDRIAGRADRLESALLSALSAAEQRQLHRLLDKLTAQAVALEKEQLSPPRRG